LDDILETVVDAAAPTKSKLSLGGAWAKMFVPEGANELDGLSPGFAGCSGPDATLPSNG
jgi:hypothetical protein